MKIIWHDMIFFFNFLNFEYSFDTIWLDRSNRRYCMFYCFQVESVGEILLQCLKLILAVTKYLHLLVLPLKKKKKIGEREKDGLNPSDREREKGGLNPWHRRIGSGRCHWVRHPFLFFLFQKLPLFIYILKKKNQ